MYIIEYLQIQMKIKLNLYIKNTCRLRFEKNIINIDIWII